MSFLRSWSKPLALAAAFTLALVLFTDSAVIEVIAGMVVTVGGVMLVDWNWRRQSERRRDHQEPEDGGIG